MGLMDRLIDSHFEQNIADKNNDILRSELNEIKDLIRLQNKLLKELIEIERNKELVK